jgi:hypothetical protein
MSTNGFHSLGRGISAHEMASTSGKKIANSTVGKIIRIQGRRSRFRSTVATVAAAVAAGLLVPGAALACDAQKHIAARHIGGHERAPLAIGDSVMLGAAERLARAGFEVDARGCRQMAAGVDILRSRRRAGTLPRVVIVALGTNWVITRADVRRTLAILGPRRLLVLVTPRELGGGSSSDAQVVRDAGRRHPRRVAVADWVRVSAGHGSWFAGDGIHLGAGGIDGMARMLRPYLHAKPPERPPCP